MRVPKLAADAYKTRANICNSTQIIRHLQCLRKGYSPSEVSFSDTEPSSPIHTSIISTAMANRAGGGSAAVVVMALLAAMLIVGQAEAGRHFRHRRHHHSPPAPPGDNEPMAAPSPFVSDEPSASPADGPVDGFPFAGGPEAAGPEAAGPEGFQSRRLSGSDREGPGADCPPGTEGPEAAGPEGYRSQRTLSESDGFAESPLAFGEGPASGEGPTLGEGPAPVGGC